MRRTTTAEASSSDGFARRKNQVAMGDLDVYHCEIDGWQIHVRETSNAQWTWSLERKDARGKENTACFAYAGGSYIPTAKKAKAVALACLATAQYARGLCNE